MKHDIKDIVTSIHLRGKKFWVCDYRKDSTDKKANRAIPPTEIMIVTSQDYRDAALKEPTVYYSNVAFAKLDKNGNPKLKQLVPPFDTTGYRSYTGIGINVFDSYDECVKFYNEQIDKIIEMYENKIETIVQSLEYELEEIKKLKK